MADIKKEALEAADQFKFRAIRNAALDAVALHESLASYEDELEEQYLEEKAAASKTAAPPDKPDPEAGQGESPFNEEWKEQPSAEPAEVQRDEPAAKAPHITAPPPAVEPPPAEIEEAPPAVETPEVPAVDVPAEEPAEPESEHGESEVREEVEAKITDPDTVEAIMEFLKEEDLLDAYSFEIKKGVWGWREASNFATISFGDKEYVVAPTYDAAEEFATAMVRQMLADEPDTFNKDWLESYIDTEALEARVRPDVEDMIRQSPDSYGWEPGKIRDEDEDDEEEGVQLSLPAEDEPSDEWIEEKIDELLKDPVEYLNEIYGDETMKRAIEIAGINEEDAAIDAVAADGMGHFLSSYNGNTYELPSGGVYWRTN